MFFRLLCPTPFTTRLFALYSSYHLVVQFSLCLFLSLLHWIFNSNDTLLYRSVSLLVSISAPFERLTVGVEHLATELDGGWGMGVVLREAQDYWEHASFVWRVFWTPNHSYHNFHKAGKGRGINRVSIGRVSFFMFSCLSTKQGGEVFVEGCWLLLWAFEQKWAKE